MSNLKIEDCEYTHFGVFIDPAVKNEFKSYCKKNGMKMAYKIGQLITEFLEKENESES